MKQITILFTAMLFLSVKTMAQLPSGVEDDGEVRFNQVKLNLAGLAFNNYAVQYERILKKKASVALSVRFMPEGKLPFHNAIRKSVANEDVDLQNTIDQLRVSNFAITPEYRFYFGKGYGRGFYIAPFYRYARFKTNNIIITYDSDILGNKENVNLSGSLSSNTAGLLFGAQWALGKNISLDWMILGPHYGAGKGNFIGVSSKALSQSEQQDVRQQLEDLDIPFAKKTIEVNAQGATMSLTGPWAGVRAGISLGYRF